MARHQPPPHPDPFAAFEAVVKSLPRALRCPVVQAVRELLEREADHKDRLLTFMECLQERMEENYARHFGAYLKGPAGLWESKHRDKELRRQALAEAEAAGYRTTEEVTRFVLDSYTDLFVHQNGRRKGQLMDIKWLLADYRRSQT
jgi:hypothetical protein